MLACMVGWNVLDPIKSTIAGTAVVFFILSAHVPCRCCYRCYRCYRCYAAAASNIQHGVTHGVQVPRL